jgi:hypothetical protein
VNQLSVQIPIQRPCLIVWIPVWFQIVYRYPPEAGEFGWVFLHEARHRIDADDVLSKIDILLNWEAFLPIIKRG